MVILKKTSQKILIMGVLKHLMDQKKKFFISKIDQVSLSFQLKYFLTFFHRAMLIGENKTILDFNVLR